LDYQLDVWVPLFEFGKKGSMRRRIGRSEEPDSCRLVFFKQRGYSLDQERGGGVECQEAYSDRQRVCLLELQQAAAFCQLFG
jgi:hypothetical protein